MLFIRLSYADSFLIEFLLSIHVQMLRQKKVKKGQVLLKRLTNVIKNSLHRKKELIPIINLKKNLKLSKRPYL